MIKYKIINKDLSDRFSMFYTEFKFDKYFIMKSTRGIFSNKDLRIYRGIELPYEERFAGGRVYYYIGINIRKIYK